MLLLQIHPHDLLSGTEPFRTRRKRQPCLFQRDIDAARPLSGVILANSVAVRTAHDEPPTDGWPVCVNPAVHMGAIHGDTPPIFSPGHHLRPFRKVCGEMSRDVVLGLQNHHQAAAHSVARRAIGCPLG
jgi:hypothetical protein